MYRGPAFLVLVIILCFVNSGCHSDYVRNVNEIIKRNPELETEFRRIKIYKFAKNSYAHVGERIRVEVRINNESRIAMEGFELVDETDLSLFIHEKANLINITNVLPRGKRTVINYYVIPKVAGRYSIGRIRIKNLKEQGRTIADLGDYCRSEDSMVVIFPLNLEIEQYVDNEAINLGEEIENVLVIKNEAPPKIDAVEIQRSRDRKDIWLGDYEINEKIEMGNDQKEAIARKYTAIKAGKNMVGKIRINKILIDGNWLSGPGLYAASGIKHVQVAPLKLSKSQIENILSLSQLEDHKYGVVFIEVIAINAGIFILILLVRFTVLSALCRYAVFNSIISLLFGAAIGLL